MKKTLSNSFKFYKGLQEWFDPATEGSPYIRSKTQGVRVKITLDGIARKTVWIVK
jgi:hypothetical protein